MIAEGRKNQFEQLANNKALFSAVAVFLLAFLAAFLSSSLFVPVNTSNADDQVIANLTNTGYYIDVSSSDVILNLNATPDGTLAVAKDTVKTATNADGYQLYLSMAAAEETEVIDGKTITTNSLVLEGSDSTTGDYISPSSGTFTTPQKLAVNTWGFAVSSKAHGLPDSAGAFDEEYALSSSGATNKENKFAQVPVKNNLVRIQETDAPNEAGEELDVYYGVHATAAKTEGTYAGTIVYTAVAEDKVVPAGITPDTTFKLAGGDTITATLYSNLAIAAADISIDIDGDACTVLSATTASGVVTITCSSPAKSAGSYPVTLTVISSGQTYSLGNLTYGLSGTTITNIAPNSISAGTAATVKLYTDISASGISLADVSEMKVGDKDCTDASLAYESGNLVITCTTSASLSGSASGTVYSGSFIISGTKFSGGQLSVVKTGADDFWTITYMQEMTPEICASVHTPSNATGDAVNIIDNAADYASVITDGTPNVAQRVLYDIRDNKQYTVRKLADGNCWMTENLQLELVAGNPVTASYNDGSTFSWIPRGSSTGGGTSALNGNTMTPASNGESYYTWYAATADAGQDDDLAVDIDGSICPVGWKLPYSYNISNDKSYGGLLIAYGIPATRVNSTTAYVTTLEAQPLSFARYGTTYALALGSVGATGAWWSSTSYGTSYRWRVHFWYDTYRYSLVEAEGHDYASSGFQIRCVAL